MAHLSENASIKFMNYVLNSSSYNPSLIQKILFELNLLSQGSIEQDHPSKNEKKIRVSQKDQFQ